MRQNLILLSALVMLVFSSREVLAVKPAAIDRKVTSQYTEVKNKYLKTVDTYNKGYADFKAVRDQAKRLGKIEGNAELLDRAKKHLKNSLERIIRHLEVLKTRAQNSSGMESEVKAAIIAEIDEDIAFLQTQLAEMDAISSVAEIRELGKTIREYWFKVRVRSRRIVGHTLAARFRHFIARMDRLAARISTELETLKAQGIDVSEAEALLDDFNRNRDLAEEKYEAARDVFESISNLEEAQSLFRQGHALLREAHQYLRVAHQDLKEVVQSLKSEGTE